MIAIQPDTHNIPEWIITDNGTYTYICVICLNLYTCQFNLFYNFYQFVISKSSNRKKLLICLFFGVWVCTVWNEVAMCLIGIIAEVMENKFEVYSKVIGDSMIEWFSTFSV